MNGELFGFDAWKRKFLKHLERHCYSAETSDGYGKTLECFRRFVTEGSLEQDFILNANKKNELLQFMDDAHFRENKTITISRRLSTLKSFYKYLVYELHYSEDVATRIRIPKVYTPLKKLLMEEVVQRLLCSSSPLPPCLPSSF